MINYREIFDISYNGNKVQFKAIGLGQGTLKLNVKSEKDIKETFAANVFDLYRMSFFMNDGLIGEFAQEKIKKLFNRIDNGETIGIVNEIKMIGDNRIREFLMEKYREKHSDEKSLNDEIIKYYQDIIEQLKK